MVRSENVNVYLVSQSLKAEVDQSEKWYGTEFSRAKFSKGMLELMQNPDVAGSLSLPAQNHYLPENLDLLATNSKESTAPILIKDD